MKQLPRILTIAGSDSGGGAGIQADLKTITALQCYGLSVITALTAQNTLGVEGIHAPPASFVATQLKTVLTDIDVAAAKTGMLFSASIMKAVSPFLREAAFPVVVDPVCVSQSGHKLLEDDAVEAMREFVFPHAALLTPNIPEAELFTGMTIRTPEEIAEAARRLLEQGPKAVLIKGGHGMDSVASTDWFARPGHKPLPFMQRRVDTNNNHGTGCTLSAAIATYAGQGLEMSQAVREAQRYLNLCLRDEIHVGNGSGPPNHLAPVLKEGQRWPVLQELSTAMERLAGLPGVERVIPKQGLNMALSMPFSRGFEDVATLDAPVCRSAGGRVFALGRSEYGIENDEAAVLLSVRKVREDVRCCLSLRPGEDVLSALAAMDVVLARFDRADAPATPQRACDAALEWGAYHALSNHKAVDRVSGLADGGAYGLGGRVCLWAAAPGILVKMVEKLIGLLK
ncbi:hydroxymethylpyrimidine/phosphomethylpyrimidine kinase [Paucidesulfovibrio gracilis DSM 16080]|uniref:hydroxymethylpyrimidine kinase n=1 Tax=Paucidesulfovibrio gracilis DSM 16080 TaxID=1121449 RepID=A0A1T4WRP5_9BACT|nr:bifunctional hydroxymethylpyrimidine kinase/phosphomethylpyrimidine kinase [Paucidesulfovibrio gracilis]SKA80052.1 hydroxymethylpyrimidine/phosphomethylpyrimidine kinase [Paucidesulfovibrio gracilis DSM 16080]